ncbi:ATP-binding protein [Actinocrinis sp.]|uniref:ATP-binding protein n=1 Tax=Actinocrinis sp. TaxID=1920516 RepID=UPI002D2972D7|nr:ATP-binding protein [Actinocrinis sp.]HZP51001.1 ATP-binding protein [Actinocrinis sp.]
MVPDPRLARLLAAMRAVRDGDLGARASVTGDDELAELGELFNQLAEHNQALADQIAGLSGAAALRRLTESASAAAATAVAATGAASAAGSAAPGSASPGPASAGPAAPAAVATAPGTESAAGDTAAGDTAAGDTRTTAAAARQLAQIEQARLELNEHARQLAVASRAKAEFMANISHELRTPLSSLLILAQLLATNTEGNLTPRQMDFARTIHGAAQDLLQLINDLFDLANVESGRMAVHTDRISVDTLVTRAEAEARQQAAQKGLELIVQVAQDAPESIDSDEQRLQQILRNLLSNAVKFTERGSITLEVTRDAVDPALLRFAVHDTGIGIAADRHEAIFEAFQHGDSVTGRRFGGSGLGLSISRELTRLLGGELRVSSMPGQGSTFTLTVPIESGTSAREKAQTPGRTRSSGQSGAAGGSGAKKAAAARNGGPAESGVDGSADALSPAELAEAAAAASDDSTGFLALGVETPQPAAVVLIVEPQAARAMQHAARTAIDGVGSMRGRVDLLVMPEVTSREIERALTGHEVVSVLVNLSMPPAEVQTLLATVARLDPTVPVLAYEAGAGSGTTARLAALGSVRGLEVIGSRAQAIERLTLHLLTALPNPTAEMSLAAEPPQSAIRFNGEKVLVVDDDVRNVFALASALELHGLSVVHADNGRQGIETLLQNPDIKLVLMDVMMPGMDGYAATEYIRSLEQFAELPIIAVTAKAMTGDRERSLAAGANAHVPKPVEVDVLLALIRSMISD